MTPANALKLIELELAAGFLKTHRTTKILPGRLFGMDFDLVSYSVADRILWFCEMTVSGFLGGRKGNFHVGASRKFCEGFAKFSVLKLKDREAKEHLRRVTNDPTILDAQIECRLVVPRGCRSMLALGWREGLIGTVMEVEEIDLSNNAEGVMIQALHEKRREQQKVIIEGT